MQRFLWTIVICALAVRGDRSPAQAPGSVPATQLQRRPLPRSGVRAEFLNELKIQEDKFVALAQAIPADKYTWRPAEGVRSISEVFMHVAAANYNLTKVLGVPPPAGLRSKGMTSPLPIRRRSLRP